MVQLNAVKQNTFNAVVKKSGGGGFSDEVHFQREVRQARGPVCALRQIAETGNI